MGNRKHLRLFIPFVLLLGLVGVLSSGSVIPAHAQEFTPLQGIPQGAGRLWITGHDAEKHCVDTSGGDQCNYFRAAVNWVMNNSTNSTNSTLPILALDHGGQIETAVRNAFVGGDAPEVRTLDPRTEFAGHRLVSNGNPRYSVIIVASDVTCSSPAAGGLCSNNELDSTPDSDAINDRAADILEFFLAGGGILALAGAEHSDVYYDFLPIEVTPKAVTPSPGDPGNDGSGVGAFTFRSSQGGLTWGQVLKLSNDDINCCVTHNSFQPNERTGLTGIEFDAATDPETDEPSGAVTLIGTPGRSRAQEEEAIEKARSDYAISSGIGALLRVGKLISPSRVVQGVWTLISGLKAALANSFLKDPIDLNFQVIAEPIVPDVPKVSAGPDFTAREADVINAFINNQVEQIAVTDAFVTSLDRVQGAQVAENETWEARQLQAAQQYAAQLAKLFEAEQRLIDDVTKAFPTSERLTAEDVQETQEDIEANGLPEPLVSILEQLGASRGDINQIQQDLIAIDPNDVAALGGGRFPQLLADQAVIDATQRAADALKQFAEAEAGDDDKDCDMVGIRMDKDKCD